METENYILREIQDSDISNIYKGLSNPEITQYYDIHFESLADAKEQMRWYKKLQKDGTGIWWGIHTKQNNNFCGAAGFNDLNSRP